MLVKSAKEEELTPIQNAVELVDKQTSDLRRVTDAEPVDRQALQMLLQGSVNPQVHGGTLEVAETFLGAEAPHDLSRSDVAKLRKGLARFLHSCRDAILLNKATATEIPLAVATAVGGGSTDLPTGERGALAGSDRRPPSGKLDSAAVSSSLADSASKLEQVRCARARTLLVARLTAWRAESVGRQVAGAGAHRVERRPEPHVDRLGGRPARRAARGAVSGADCQVVQRAGRAARQAHQGQSN